MKALSFFLLTGCASGTSALSAGEDASRPESPDAREETVFDAAVDGRPDAPPDAPPDAAIVAPDACVPVSFEKLANPSLDLAPNGVGWVGARDPFVDALPGGPFPIISANPAGLVAQSAPNKAWLGGASGEDVTPIQQTLTDQLHQDITFPADATNVVVRGFILVGTTEEDPVAFDNFQIDITETNGTQIENVLVANNLTVADTFTSFEKVLGSNVAGKTVRLRLLAINDITLHTNFFIDSLSVQANHCP